MVQVDDYAGYASLPIQPGKSVEVTGTRLAFLAGISTARGPDPARGQLMSSLQRHGGPMQAPFPPSTLPPGFPSIFWVANVTELFERGAYYAMARSTTCCLCT